MSSWPQLLLSNHTEYQMFIKKKIVVTFRRKETRTFAFHFYFLYLFKPAQIKAELLMLQLFFTF